MFRIRSALAAILAAVILIAGCGGHPARHRAAAHAIVAPQPGQSAMGSVHPPGWGATPPGFSLPHTGAQTFTPTGEMFDTITLSTVPAKPFALAGYTAGHWPTFLPLRSAFPAAHTISIAISWGYRADCLDVEPGDATPAQAGAWARADIAAGFPRPCLYSDLSEMPAVKASLVAAGLTRDRYLLWLAWYRFRPGLVAGYDAVQWTDHAFGRNLDESTVAINFVQFAHPPYIPHSAPKPKPRPKPQRWASAQIQIHGLTGTVVAHERNGRWTVGAGRRVHPMPFDSPPLGR